jgi:hypothetical protein
MRTILLVVSLVLMAPCWAEGRVLEEISWEKLQREAGLLSGELMTETETGLVCLKVVHSSSGPVTLPLVVLAAPKITRSEYALVGQVRCEAVAGEGYLETWNYFGETEKYFSRTLSPSGPMGVLSGNSGWRPFRLPFFTNDNAKHPSKIEVNLVLPGKGTVYLSDLQLVQSSAWWSDQSGGWLGGILGCLGGFFGILGGISGSLVAKGKGRGLAFGTLYTMAGLGGLLLLLGLSALSLSQPYHVYYPLLLGGVLFTALGLGLIPNLKRTFEQAELRKMKAMDAR